MSKVTRLNLEEGQIGERRRLHLHDIQDDSPEPAGSVGSELRSARVARGEDIETVANALRIRRAHLEAIEGSDQSRLPGRTYAMGFIRSYAEYLGLDAPDLVARYKAEQSGDETQTTGQHELVFPEGEDESRMPRGWLIVLAILIAAGLYGGWMLATSADRMAEERAQNGGEVQRPRVVEAEPEPAPPPSLGIVRPAQQAAAEDAAGTAGAETDAEATAGVAGAEAPAEAPEAGTAAETEAPDEAAADPAAEQPAEAEAAAPAEQETQAEAEAAVDAIAASGEHDQIPEVETGGERPWEGFVYGQQNHDSRIFIRAQERTWVRVEDGQGNVLISRTLRAGESYRAPNRPGMVLATRNAGAVQLYVDGKPAGKAGQDGEVIVDLPLDADRLAAQ